MQSFLRHGLTITMTLICLVIGGRAFALPKPVNGVVDLQGFNLGEMPLSLDGQWRFFPGRFISVNDLQDLSEFEFGFIPVPGLWQQLSQDPNYSSIVDTKSFGTYVLEIDDLQVDDDLAITNMLSIIASRMIWVQVHEDGLVQQIHHFGVPSHQVDEEKPWIQDAMVRITKPTAAKTYLIIHVSSLRVKFGGMLQAPMLQNFPSAKKDHQIRFYQIYFLLGIFLMASLFNLMLFRKRQNDRASLWMSLICLLCAARLIATENALEHLFDTYHYHIFLFNVHLRNFVILLVFSCYISFCYWSSSGTVSRQLVKSVWFLNGGYACLAIILPLDVVEHLWMAMYIVNLALAMYLIVAIILAVKKHLEGAKYLLIAVSSLCLGGINDLLVFLNIYQFPYLFHYSLAMFIFFNTHILGIRFVRALDRSEQLVQVMQEHEKSRSRFFRSISHELRTPLNGLLGMLDLTLRGKYGNIPDSVRLKLQNSREIVVHLRTQLGHILDLAKVQQQEMELDFRLIHLNSLVEQVEEFGRRLLADHSGTSFTCRWDWREEERSFINDYSKLVVIIQSLLRNAFKFKDPKRTNHIEISFVHLPTVALTIKVTDTGMGISKKDQARVFKAFEQVHSDEKNQLEGAGIGLTLVKRLVDVMGGKIELISRLAHSSEFIVTIPHKSEIIHQQKMTAENKWVGSNILECPPKQNHSRSKESDINVHKQAKEKIEHKDRYEAEIYICDGNQINRDVITQIVSSYGYKTKVAISGEQVLEMMVEHRPDLLILDLFLPTMSGADLIKNMRSDHRLATVPVILMTARSAKEDSVLGLSLNVDDYIAKPFDVEELIVRVDKVIERQHLYQKRIEHEHHLQAAMLVQKALLPRKLQLNGFKIQAFYQASDHLGGDWYQFFYDEQRSRLFVVMGDVTGHGLASALITASVAGAFHAFFQTHTKHPTADCVQIQLKELVLTINDAVLDLGEQSRKLMTMAFICIDLENESATYINAGHERIFIADCGQVKSHLIAGSPLGLSRQMSIRCREFPFHKGSRLMIFTDGLVEESPFESQNKAYEKIGVIMSKPESISVLFDDLIETFSLGQNTHLKVDDCSFVILERDVA
ncbi:MAG: SpoIIE family protein phosphatase [Oligoflexus sp.]